MTEDEKAYQAELKRNGVELDEEAEVEAEPEAEKPEAKAEPEAPEKDDAEEDADQDTLKAKPKEDAKPQRPRSIYDEYKDKKSEAKTEKQRADAAERERDEWKQKFEGISEAKPGQETKDAEKDLRTYAAERGADPELVDRIIAEARKGLKPELDPEIKKDLAEFKAWKQTNGQAIEQQMFDAEFKTLLPTLKQQFPNASEAELDGIKTKLDAISHTKEFHDKDLDYVAFKNRTELEALVSPKKRGMESKERKAAEAIDTDFDPNADYASMSSAQRKKWEAQYRGLGKREGLTTGSDGKKLFV